MLSFFPRGVLDEILNLIESVSEEFPSYSFLLFKRNSYIRSVLQCLLAYVIRYFNAISFGTTKQHIVNG